LKVDAFLNHQIDPVLMQQIGKEFAARFKDAGLPRLLPLKLQVLHLQSWQV
jgi:xanthine phosphoribosyltransferase